MQRHLTRASSAMRRGASSASARRSRWINQHQTFIPSSSSAPGWARGCNWLTDRNVFLAREHGVGLEETYAFDQDQGKIEPILADGRKIVANGQLLGSFDPG